MNIRPATLSDIPAVARIYSASVINGTATFELEPPTEAVMAERMRHLLDAGFPYLAAELDRAVTGYAYAAAYRIRPAYRFTVENSVYVSPAAQRRGIGRALLDALIEESARRGFRQMVAVIGDSPNQIASVTLHRGAGFRVVGTLDRVGFKHGRWLDSLLMQRALGEGGSSPPERGSESRSSFASGGRLGPLSSQTKCNTFLRGCCHGAAVQAAIIGRAVRHCPPSSRRVLDPANCGSFGSLAIEYFS